MTYRVIYRDNLNESGVGMLNNDICFSSLFSQLKQENTGSVEIYMCPQIKGCEHDLKFTKDEIDFVFQKLSDIITVPTLEYIDKNGLCLTFNFNKATIGHVKTALIISRYFYEYNGDQDEITNDFFEIMRSTIDYCKANPDDSFIETLQLFHYNLNYSIGHCLVRANRCTYPTQINSEASIIKNINNIHCYNVFEGYESVFSNFKSAVITNTKDYFKTFKDIPRV